MIKTFLLSLIILFNVVNAQVYRVNPLPPAYMEVNFDCLNQSYKQISNDLLYVKSLKFISGTDKELNYSAREGFYSFQFDDKQICNQIVIRFDDHLLAEEFIGLFRNDYAKMDWNLWVNSLTQKLIRMQYVRDEILFVIKRI